MKAVKSSYLKASVVNVSHLSTYSKRLALPLPASLVLRMRFATEATKSAQPEDTGDLTPPLKPSLPVSTLMDVLALNPKRVMTHKVPVERATLGSYVGLANKATLATLATNATSVLSHMPTFLFYSGF